MALQYGNSSGTNVEVGGPYGSAAPNARISELIIKASAWKGAASPYYQTVLLENMSVNSKVDLLPSVDQVRALCAANIALTTENDSGVLTVYAIGAKPASDMTVQVSITEVTT